MITGLVKRNGILGQFSNFELDLLDFICSEHAPFLNKQEVILIFNQAIDDTDNPEMCELINDLKIKFSSLSVYTMNYIITLTPFDLDWSNVI